MYSPEVLRGMNDKVEAKWQANRAAREAKLEKELAFLRSGGKHVEAQPLRVIGAGL